MKTPKLCLLIISGMMLLAAVPYYLFSTLSRSSLVINEVCSRNFNIITADGEDYYPRFYIELYNPGPVPVDMTGWRLSAPDTPENSNIIGPMEVSPGEYGILFADESDRLVRKGPKAEGVLTLDKDSRELALYDAEGRDVDRILLPQTPVNVSYARVYDGAREFDTKYPTPYAPNHISGHADVAAADAPALSEESGFYDEPFYLNIRSGGSRDLIYYTTDGSTPTRESILYEGSIYIEDATKRPNEASAREDLSAKDYYIPDYPVAKANIIKAVSYSPDGTMSQIATGIYFVSEDGELEDIYGAGVPVLSITADHDKLWDAEDGMLVLGNAFEIYKEQNELPPKDIIEDYYIQANFRYKSKKWEKVIQMDLLDNGSHTLSQDVGMKNRGKSGSDGPKKSLSLVSRSIFGQKGFAADIFGSGKRADAAILKRTKCIMRDGFIMELSRGLRIPESHSIPVNVFINGEYWGLYLLIERYDEAYFSGQYGVPEGKIAIIKNGSLEAGSSGSKEDFKEMFTYAATHDLSVEENYQYLCSILDMESFMDYYAVMIFTGNHDTADAYNMMAWRTDEVIPGSDFGDGRWHYVPYDIDSTFSEPERDDLTLEIRADRPAFFQHTIMKAALANEGFRRSFYEKLQNIMDNEFSPERVLPLIDEKEALLSESMVEDHMRYEGSSPGEASEAVKAEFDGLREYFRLRRGCVTDYMDAYYDGMTSP